MKQLLFLLLFFPGILLAQKKSLPKDPNVIVANCTIPGTHPTTAIPVCGTKTFHQGLFTNCSDGPVVQNNCVGDDFSSDFAFWYKFTCFSAGNLEFTINPLQGTDDLDWVLYDLTGHSPLDVLMTPPPANPCFPISINGTGVTGATGCSPAGTSNVVCYNGSARFNRPEPLIAGHNYLLIIQNFSNSLQGYDLSFGGTAGITDGALPALDHIESGCTSFKVFFGTDVKCSSVTSSGSELTINPGGIKPLSISSPCSIGAVAITSLTVNLATPLAPGNYTLSIDNGTDANTYTNICDNAMPQGTMMNFTVLRPIGNFILPPENCLNTVTNFTSTSDPLLGNSVTQWHWDFGDPGSGVNNTSTLQNPSHTFSAGGSFLVKHWIVNSLGCNSDTSQQMMTINKLPTAAFNYTSPKCETRVISFTDLSAPNVGALDQWTWDFGDGPPTSSLQNPSHIYAAAGAYTVTLTVRNDKGCISNPISSSVINIDNRPQAGFIIPEVCLSDSYAQFIDTSKLTNAAIDRWLWDFGDPGSGALNTSTLQNPTHSYSSLTTYNVRLIVWNNAKGCRDTITQALVINGSFPIANFNVNNSTTLCANQPVDIVEASSVFPGSIGKVEIWFDNVSAGPPGPPDITDNFPFAGKVYNHLYPNFQAPLTKVFQIRYRAYSGGVCMNDKLSNITVHAAPRVQFNNMPNTCLLVAPFQITQASEIGAVPGTGVFSGPGISASGIFDPQVAGIGTHTITYTFTSSAAGCVDSKSNTITVLDTAHAIFTFISPSCEQLPTSFTDISTAPGPVTMTNTVWDFGDLTPTENHAPGSTFGHIFPGPGTYTVTMYNESAAGCRSTITTRQVTIDPNHSISLTSANNIQTWCINKTIDPIIYNLAGGASGATVANLPPGVTYSVTGTTLTIAGTPTSTLNSPYNFTVQTTGNTCLVAQAVGKITVEPDHTIAFSSGDTTQSVCLNTPIDPIVYTIGGGANNVTIANLPPGITYTVTGNTITISGSPTTTAGGPLFQYAIQTTGNSCVKANAVGEIRVNPYPVANFALDKPGYCLPNAIVKFNNTSAMPDGSSMTYTWDFDETSSGLNNFSTLVNPSHWYNSVGPFNVKLTARSMAMLNNNVIGCPHDTIIAVKNIHPQPMANFEQSQPGACLGDVVSFKDRSLPLDGVTTNWFWDMGDGTQFNIPAFTYTHQDTLDYNIRFYTVNSNGCNSDTINRPFKVYPNPTIYAGEDKMILQGARVIFAPVATGVELQYLWTPNLYFPNGNNTIKNAEAWVKEDITYYITVTARGGCIRRDDIYIKVLKPPVIPNTFTPNNDGTNDKWLITYLDDYPDCQVEVFTRAGQLVFKSVKGYRIPWDGKRNGKALPVDTYYYIIEPGFGRDPITGYITIMK
jgi:gliding motility-associated-like protein